MMERQDASKVESRRGFLKLAGLGAATAGVALAAGETPAEAAPETKPGAAGYRETAHVRQAYATARF